MKAKLSKQKAKDIWIDSQRLNRSRPFGKGAEAVKKAIEHLGYVQIDTINVIERCHHHILYSRIPEYKLSDLHKSQSIDKTIFEYWTHALAYVPTCDYKFFVRDMKRRQQNPNRWYANLKTEDLKKVRKLLQKGPLSIRDIKDDVLVEKDHDWASQKPSKKALQFGFNTGEFTISERQGMLKKYDLTLRHFAWDKTPKMTTEADSMGYVLDRSLKAQGIISIESSCHLEQMPFKKSMLKLIEKMVQSKKLIEVDISGVEKTKHWIQPETLEKKIITNELTHILSPFDPLIIQRKRLNMFFDYLHVFEAYVPANKRKFGYFALPVLSGNEIISVIDLKTNRQQKKLDIQKWTWLKKFKSKENKKLIEAELERFEKFQLQSKDK